MFDTNQIKGLKQVKLNKGQSISHRKETGIPILEEPLSGHLQNSGFPFPSLIHSPLAPNCLFGIIGIFDREGLNFLSRRNSPYFGI